MTVLLGLSALMGLAICIRGLQADFMPSFRPIASIGSIGLTEPGLEVARMLNLQPGERVVPVGRMNSLADPVPLAWLAYSGNGPALFGVPTLAIYEPLEHAKQASYRGGITLPWRESLSDQMDLATFRKVDAFLGQKGARHYLFKAKPTFEGPTIRQIRLQNGETLWVVQSERWQPWLRNAQGAAGPNPEVDGHWRIPEGESWRIATSRTLWNPQGKPVLGDTWFKGGQTLKPRPLGAAGNWVGIWYLSLILGLASLWLVSNQARAHLGLPSPKTIWTGWRERKPLIWFTTTLLALGMTSFLWVVTSLCMN